MKKNPCNPLSTLRHLAGTVLLVLLATACNSDETLTDPQGNPLNPDGTVTISRLDVRMAGDGDAASAANAAPAPADPGAAPGTANGVKTDFVAGDVLHLMVVATEADDHNNNRQLSTATYNGTSWTLNPAIKLPQNAQDAYMIDIIYDSKRTEYKRYIYDFDDANFYAADNHYRAGMELGSHVNDGTPWPDSDPTKATAKEDANGNAYFRDGLYCTGGTSYSGEGSTVYGSLTIAPGGTLTVGMMHCNALVRVSSLINQLGSPVARAEIITAPDAYTPYHTFTLHSSCEADGQTPGAGFAPESLPWQAVIGTNGYYRPLSIRLTLADGRTFTVPLPGAGTDGFYTNFNHVYTYRLTLLPGSFSATLDDSQNGVAWLPQPDPAVPQGYTAIRTRADLEAIGATLRSMSGNYILMNDIDLTPANPASPTPAELWTPLGYETEGVDPGNIENTCALFSGRFNGNGHTLRGLTIRSERQKLGLFVWLNGAIIYNLHFSEARVEGTKLDDNAYERGIGTLAGYVRFDSTISLCSATDCTVAYTGENSNASTLGIGALVGTNFSNDKAYRLTLTRCHATRCTVSGGNADFAGGLVGSNGGFTSLIGCYTRSATVSGSYYAGGLVGSNGYGNANNLLYGCYSATATVSGGKRGNGALAGWNFGADFDSSNDLINLIVSCYATNPATAPALKLVDINDNGSGSGTIANTHGNARIIACLSPLSNRNDELPNSTSDGSLGTGYPAAGTPIVSLATRTATPGYLPLVADAALGSLPALGLGFTYADAATGISLSAPGIAVAADGSISLVTTVWNARTHLWSQLEDNSKVMPPLLGWGE